MLRRTRVDLPNLYPAFAHGSSSMGATSITTGTVALLRSACHPSVEATTLQIFRVFRAFRAFRGQNGSWCFESVDEIDMTCLQDLTRCIVHVHCAIPRRRIHLMFSVLHAHRPVPTGQPISGSVGSLESKYRAIRCGFGTAQKTHSGVCSDTGLS